MAVLKYEVDAVNEGGNRTEVNCRQFSFVIDEPPVAGGSDEGATPVEYLLGALSGCLGVVCNKVAKEMNLDVKNIRFHIEGDLDTDRFMGKCPEGKKRSGYSEIRVTIDADIDGDASQKYRWLKEVRSRCPVSDNIANMTPVKVRLV